VYVFQGRASYNVHANDRAVNDGAHWNLPQVAICMGLGLSRVRAGTQGWPSPAL